MISNLRTVLLAEIEAERKRQADEEGFDAAHDDQHPPGELLEAGIAYFWHAIGLPVFSTSVPANPDERQIPTNWPWEAHWWKPKNPYRDLIRAGALCLAEQEACQRASLPRDERPDQTLQQILDALEKMDRPNDV